MCIVYIVNISYSIWVYFMVCNMSEQLEEALAEEGGSQKQKEGAESKVSSLKSPTPILLYLPSTL